ncbi:MAG TPA: dethiobiotin synthase [Solirubrobacteraceae bacterium]|nr:dethiobiotin synthase [Solirubrobacteraceae bacterium]
MSGLLVVTGTDTDVGKTVVSAAIAALARHRGLSVAAVKPVQTGVEPGDPGDLEEIRRLSGVDDLLELARLPEPLAPATAAARAGVLLPPVEAMADEIRTLSGHDLVLVEGAGGLLVELDGRGGTIADLAVALGAPTLVVARAGLGTLNAAALTCEAIRRHGLTCLGVVIGAWPAWPDLAARCNLEDLPRYSGAPLLGRLPERASELDAAGFLRAAREGLSEGVLDGVAAHDGPRA